MRLTFVNRNLILILHRIIKLCAALPGIVLKYYAPLYLKPVYSDYQRCYNLEILSTGRITFNRVIIMVAKYADSNYKGNYRPQLWLLAATLLIPLTLGLACSATSSNSQQPERHATGPIVNATFEQLVNHANAILVGTVSNIIVNQASDGKDYRLVTLMVEQALKGVNVGQAVVRVPGGDAGSSTDTIKFTRGERVLVLLDTGTGSFTIDGGANGKFNIDGNNNVDGKPLAEFIGLINDIISQQKK